MPCTSRSVSTRTETRTRSDGTVETVTITEERKMVDGKEEVTRKEEVHTSDGSKGLSDFAKSFPPIDLGVTDTSDKIAKGDATPPKDVNTMIDEAVEQHNVYREKHGAGPLEKSEKLCAYAQEWAENLANSNKFQHRSDRKYGENIFQGYSSSGGYTAKDAVESWYAEVKNYDFNSHGFTGNTGHFTQVVWKGSKEVGIGIATSNTGMMVVVANYDPAGNMLDQYAQNVGPPN